MKRFALCLLSCILCLSVAAQAANTPIYVDGSGSELNGGTPITTPTTTTPPTTETPSTEGEAGSTGSGEHITEGVVTEDESPAEPTVDPGPAEYEAVPLTATYQGQQVSVSVLGTVVCTLAASEGTQQVYTRELTFTTEAKEDQQLAYINAPRTGKATMHRKASGKSAMLKKCDTGTIVTVLAVGKKYTKILYHEAEGYVLTSALTFVTPLKEGDGLFNYIAYKGNTKSRNTVKVRMNGSANSRVIGEYPCGTLVTVLTPGDKWTEIEVSGLHCYILTEFLTNA